VSARFQYAVGHRICGKPFFPFLFLFFRRSFFFSPPRITESPYKCGGGHIPPPLFFFFFFFLCSPLFPPPSPGQSCPAKEIRRKGGATCPRPVAPQVPSLHRTPSPPPPSAGRGTPRNRPPRAIQPWPFSFFFFLFSPPPCFQRRIDRKQDEIKEPNPIPFPPPSPLFPPMPSSPPPLAADSSRRNLEGLEEKQDLGNLSRSTGEGPPPPFILRLLPDSFWERRRQGRLACACFPPFFSFLFLFSALLFLEAPAESRARRRLNTSTVPAPQPYLLPSFFPKPPLRDNAQSDTSRDETHSAPVERRSFFSPLDFPLSRNTKQGKKRAMHDYSATIPSPRSSDPFLPQNP